MTSNQGNQPEPDYDVAAACVQDGPKTILIVFRKFSVNYMREIPVHGSETSEQITSQDRAWIVKAQILQNTPF